MLIGYGRVSTADQSLDLQLDALKQAGCERIFSDKLSGASKDRPGLKEAVSHARKGDVFVIWKLDRLDRTVKGSVDFVAELAEQEVQFKSLTGGSDTTTPSGRFFFHVMAFLAQMERELIAEQTTVGLQAARQRGRIGGRKRRITLSKIASAKKLLQRCPTQRGGPKSGRIGSDALPLGTCLGQVTSDLGVGLLPIQLVTRRCSKVQQHQLIILMTLRIRGLDASNWNIGLIRSEGASRWMRSLCGSSCVIRAASR